MTAIMTDEQITARLTRFGFKRFTVDNGIVICKSYTNAMRIGQALIGYGVFVTIKK